MRMITREELDKILINHLHWLNEDCEGWQDMRADLCDADLRNANLRNANLRYADLRYANLRNADLYNATLYDADLRNTDLRNTDLHYTDLRHADLRYANLRNTDLRNAALYNADLRYANNIPFVPMACPNTGEFVAWKKASRRIIKLLVPNEAKRLSATGRNCRCDRARVLAIENIDGTPTAITEVKSDYDSNFVYKIGEIVSVNNFCEDRWKECSEGIHFFINRQEAVDY